MNRLSKNGKTRALHRVYTLVNYIDPNADIKRDSLHSRYEANKYGVRVRFDQKRWKELMSKFIDKYSEEYSLSSKDSKEYYENKEVGMVLCVREQDMNYFGKNEVLIDISIF